jgi:hypothetical protein
VELHNDSFENVLHVPNISMNLLSVYQITQKGKKVEFTSDSVFVLDMHDNSIISIGEVDHKSKFYKFTKFYDMTPIFYLHIRRIICMHLKCNMQILLCFHQF